MTTLIKKLKNKKGFTLIELIVVLAVLGVIMSIAVPKFAGVQTQAKIDADESSLAIIARTVEIYYVLGSVEKDFESGKKISEDSKLEDILEIEFSNFKLQSVNPSPPIGDLTLIINPTTGRAVAKYDSLSSNDI